MALQVYSTLSRKKEPFQTVQPGKVGMYLCGPTVYKPSHVGHMVGPVIFDTVKRYLTYLGYQVTFVVNITDVDDKLIIEAAKQGTTVTELAERVTTDYMESLKRLRVTSIDHFPRATHHISNIIHMIQGLIDKGYAYPASGDVYFNIAKDEDYGKLCNRDPEQLETGVRIEVSDKKKNPGDFALWKGAKPGEPAWESPWGLGRPGWHIECSAMSKALLGNELDIHGGGLDLQFPHHENELAQSESHNNCTFARYWMHNGLMRIRSQSSKIKSDSDTSSEGGEFQKMSKSLGNEIVVSEVLKRHHPETLRFLLLNTHYRSPIEYSEDRLQELRKALESFYRFFERYQRITGEDAYQLIAPAKRTSIELTGTYADLLKQVTELRNQFLASMDDDFNTGGAIGTLYELLGTLNRFADTEKLEEPTAKAEAKVDFQKATLVLKELSSILGLFTEPVTTSTAGNNELVSGLMQLILELRQEARKTKNFAQADLIRKRLTELGVTLEDRPTGTIWRVG